MGQTTNHALPFPESPDPADVPTDMRELAEKVDVALPPIGAPFPWLVSAIPAGYREFDGSPIVQATHPKLYALFGATMPDLRGRTLLGQDASHAVGTTGGEATHLLTAAESGIPDHNHQSYLGWQAGAYNLANWDGATHGIFGGSNEGGVMGGAKPAAQSHNNLPPYRAVRWITVAG